MDHKIPNFSSAIFLVSEPCGITRTSSLRPRPAFFEALLSAREVAAPTPQPATQTIAGTGNLIPGSNQVIIPGATYTWPVDSAYFRIVTP